MVKTFAAAFLSLILTCLAGSACASPSDISGKELRRECQKMTKQLNKEGWKVYGKKQTVDKALEEYYGKLGASGTVAYTIEGRGTANSVNIAVRKAQSNASAQYATMRESHVAGTSNINMTNTESSEAHSETQFDASYTSSTEQQVKALVPTVTLYRENKDNTVEVMSLFIVTD
ncbi:MAG: hypothetical protein J6M54_06490 [Prevotella sp.]|nr:hypothetical protein [Prevotella sp.]MBR1527644.1 hypothetical protein [Prevotella sp.]MDY6409593.1 hypothetical protein [Prevotella sp.]